MAKRGGAKRKKGFRENLKREKADRGNDLKLSFLGGGG